MQKTQVASRMFPPLPTREDIQEHVLWHCIDIMSKQSYHPYVIEQRKHVGSHLVIPFFRTDRVQAFVFCFACQPCVLYIDRVLFFCVKLACL